MALNLRRSPGQRILIGNNIVVTVNAVDITKTPPTVELGIEAPRNICIDREEVRTRRHGKIQGVVGDRGGNYNQKKKNIFGVMT